MTRFEGGISWSVSQEQCSPLMYLHVKSKKYISEPDKPQSLLVILQDLNWPHLLDRSPLLSFLGYQEHLWARRMYLCAGSMLEAAQLLCKKGLETILPLLYEHIQPVPMIVQPEAHRTTEHSSLGSTWKDNPIQQFWGKKA